LTSPVDAATPETSTRIAEVGTRRSPVRVGAFGEGGSDLPPTVSRPLTTATRLHEPTQRRRNDVPGPFDAGVKAWQNPVADTGPIDVSICIANWNCREHLRSCLESLHYQPQGVRLETIVVDNGSEDGAAEMVERDFPEVVLHRNSSNLGFARANNQ